MKRIATVLQNKTIVLAASIYAVSLLLLIATHAQLLIFEIFVSFTTQIVFTTAFCFIICVTLSITSGRLSRLHTYLFAATGLVIYLSIRTQLPSLPPHTLDTNKQLISVATFNKLLTNDDIAAAAQYFSDENVDIILLQEIYRSEAQELANMLGYEYTTTSQKYSAGSTEIAIISRFPLRNTEQINLKTDFDKGLLRAEVTIDDIRYAVYGAHITVPIGTERYDSGNQEFKASLEVLQNEELPLIFGGDLNRSVHSPVLRGFANTLMAQGVRITTDTSIPSTCSWHGFGSLLCTRIDHIFVSEEFTHSSETVSDDIGSDHRVVIQRLQVN